MLRRLTLLFAASITICLPLGGCLETLGRPSYNHGPSSDHPELRGLNVGAINGRRIWIS